MVSRATVYSSRALAGAVKRYHTWPMLQTQSVGEHCWNVACIFIEIFGLPRAEVLFYCLHHDSGELWAGDMPFGTKKKTPGMEEAMKIAEENGRRSLNIILPELSKLECVQVKICDLLEMHERGTIERNLGNLYADPIIYDTRDAAQKLAGEHDLSRPVNDWLMRVA
jgi:5'-deoxynucleotidase YfbR-like